MTFLKAAEVSTTPILFQHLTDLIFRAVLVQQSNPSIQDAMLAVTSTEANALRYAAGFVCRHLRNKLEKGNHPLKEELILCILQLIRGADANEESGTAEEWSELIDRGGLWNVRNTTFQVFCALEEEIRPSLRAFVLDSTHMDKAKAITTLISSNDVQFYWCIAAADFDIEDEETHAKRLLNCLSLLEASHMLVLGSKNTSSLKTNQPSVQRVYERNFILTRTSNLYLHACYNFVINFIQS